MCYNKIEYSEDQKRRSKNELEGIRGNKYSVFSEHVGADNRNR